MISYRSRWDLRTVERAGEPGTQSRGRNLDGSPGVAEMQREGNQEEEEGERGGIRVSISSGGSGLTTAKGKAWETLSQQRAFHESTKTHVWNASVHVAICLG